MWSNQYRSSEQLSSDLKEMLVRVHAEFTGTRRAPFGTE